MKVMISIPMNGKTGEQINSEIEQVKQRLESEGHEVIDSFITETPPDNCNQGVWYLGKSLEAMSKADALYMCEGWIKARGCVIEHNTAVVYGLQILEKSEYKELSDVE